MSRYSFLFGAFLLFSHGLAIAQEDTEEVWYVWLDAQIDKEGQNVRMVGDAPFKVTCCVKSPAFARLEKKTAAWIRENHDPNYQGRTSLKKIQDMDLAQSVISWAKRDAAAGKGITIVSYAEECVE